MTAGRLRLRRRLPESLTLLILFVNVAFIGLPLWSDVLSLPEQRVFLARDDVHMF